MIKGEKNRYTTCKVSLNEKRDSKDPKSKLLCTKQNLAKYFE